MDQRKTPSQAKAAFVRDRQEQAKASRALLDRLHREVSETEQTIQESWAAIADSLRLLNQPMPTDTMTRRR